MDQYGEEQFWSENQSYGNYNQNNGFFDQNSQFDFQNFDNTNYSNASFGTAYNQTQQPTIFTPEPINTFDGSSGGETSFDEPPLLDELEIYPERIWEKSIAVLNPFQSTGFTDPEYLFKESDLAGPIAFCLALAVCLFISGSKAHFGYIYGLCVISVILMYILISLMTNSTENYVSLTGVASILGYSILPIVWLSLIGIIFPLNTSFGMVLAGMSIFLATTASSRIFCLMTGDVHQRFLIAYPCGLVYVIFTLLVLF